jgi:hypothetical protein
LVDPTPLHLVLPVLGLLRLLFVPAVPGLELLPVPIPVVPPGVLGDETPPGDDVPPAVPPADVLPEAPAAPPALAPPLPPPAAKAQVLDSASIAAIVIVVSFMSLSPVLRTGKQGVGKAYVPNVASRIVRPLLDGGLIMIMSAKPSRQRRNHCRLRAPDLSTAFHVWQRPFPAGPPPP